MTKDRQRLDPADDSPRRSALSDPTGRVETSPNTDGPVRSRRRREPAATHRVIDTVAMLRPRFARLESDERLAERTSRVILSSLAEPGDGVLGDLLLEFGAIELLDRLWRTRNGAAGLGGHDVAPTGARAHDDSSAADSGAGSAEAGPGATGSDRDGRSRRVRAAACDSSFDGGARGQGPILAPSRAGEHQGDDVLEPFRSEEWSARSGRVDSPRRPRGADRSSGSGGSRIDSALKGVSASLETWMLRLDRVEQSLSLSVAGSVGAELLIPGDDDWPLGVDDLGRHAPVVLWVRGSPSDLGVTRPSVALVGARACSAYGQQVATDAAWHLSRRGVTLFSGGAYGIDGAVHRAAIRAGGRTVAFLAGGVDRLYPAGHHALLESIIEHGGLVSEVPCGTTPTKWRFLHNKRKLYGFIVSAL